MIASGRLLVLFCLVPVLSLKAPISKRLPVGKLQSLPDPYFSNPEPADDGYFPAIWGGVGFTRGYGTPFSHPHRDETPGTTDVTPSNSHQLDDLSPSNKGVPTGGVGPQDEGYFPAIWGGAGYTRGFETPLSHPYRDETPASNDVTRRNPGEKNRQSDEVRYSDQVFFMGGAVPQDDYFPAIWGGAGYTRGFDTHLSHPCGDQTPAPGLPNEYPQPDDISFSRQEPAIGGSPSQVDPYFPSIWGAVGYTRGFEAPFSHPQISESPFPEYQHHDDVGGSRFHVDPYVPGPRGDTGSTRSYYETPLSPPPMENSSTNVNPEHPGQPLDPDDVSFSNYDPMNGSSQKNVEPRRTPSTSPLTEEISTNVNTDKVDQTSQPDKVFFTDQEPAIGDRQAQSKPYFPEQTKRTDGVSSPDQDFLIGGDEHRGEYFPSIWGHAGYTRGYNSSFSTPRKWEAVTWADAAINRLEQSSRPQHTFHIFGDFIDEGAQSPGGPFSPSYFGDAGYFSGYNTPISPRSNDAASWIDINPHNAREDPLPQEVSFSSQGSMTEGSEPRPSMSKSGNRSTFSEGHLDPNESFEQSPSSKAPPARITTESYAAMWGSLNGAASSKVKGNTSGSAAVDVVSEGGEENSEGRDTISNEPNDMTGFSNDRSLEAHVSVKESPEAYLSEETNQVKDEVLGTAQVSDTMNEPNGMNIVPDLVGEVNGAKIESSEAAIISNKSPDEAKSDGAITEALTYINKRPDLDHRTATGLLKKSSTKDELSVVIKESPKINGKFETLENNDHDNSSKSVEESLPDFSGVSSNTAIMSGEVSTNGVKTSSTVAPPESESAVSPPELHRPQPSPPTSTPTKDFPQSSDDPQKASRSSPTKKPFFASFSSKPSQRKHN